MSTRQAPDPMKYEVASSQELSSAQAVRDSLSSRRWFEGAKPGRNHRRVLPRSLGCLDPRPIGSDNKVAQGLHRSHFIAPSAVSGRQARRCVAGRNPDFLNQGPMACYLSPRATTSHQVRTSRKPLAAMGSSCRLDGAAGDDKVIPHCL